MEQCLHRPASCLLACHLRCHLGPVAASNRSAVRFVDHLSIHTYTVPLCVLTTCSWCVLQSTFEERARLQEAWMAESGRIQIKYGPSIRKTMATM
jgi:hypothetical protein